jgi:nucleoside-diphosphate-sugar epimerase
MVHIGSGCVYETNRCSGIGFSENDKPNFKGSFYSRTKIFAENILSEYDNILQLRIRMPIDNIPSPRNLIDKLIGYRQVINVPNSITYIPDFITVAKKLMDMHETGIFNVVNTGAITHKEILQMYQQIVDPDYIMAEFIPVEKLDTMAGRSNCILYNTRLEGKGIQIRHVLDALEECMQNYAKQSGRYI